LTSRRRIALLFGLLIAANLACWGWAFSAFSTHPLLIGTALLAYGFGLRHAIDADHIAAIDNVTRKLMQEGKRPLCVGLYFSLGHSTIVVAASVAIAATAAGFRGQLEQFRQIGGTVGTLVSSGFLLAIAAMNAIVLLSVIRRVRRLRAGEVFCDGEAENLFAGSGFLARMCRPLFRMIGQSWHMYPLGVLFGLGFDTATEIGLLGISAAEASHGLPVWSILVFPALFTAGMSLVDTADGVVMLGAYGWAFGEPVRKLYYNMAITFVSVVVALLVGGIEALGLVGDHFAFHGAAWRAISTLNGSLGILGGAIIALFILGWLASATLGRRLQSE